MNPPDGLRIVASNRLETLVGALAEEMRRRPAPPLVAERIVVPHPALGRWLRLALASELGIAANLRVELPAEFAWSAMREAVPKLASQLPFAPASLRWRIFDALEAEAAGTGEEAEETDALRRYLADADPRNRFELAHRLAHVFDRCLLYRPEWIRAWQAGDAPNWQARLWAALIQDAGTPLHWVDAIDAYRRALGQADAPTQPSGQMELPLGPAGELPRASLFGIMGLSPSYLDMLRAAATRMDVRLYLLSPCREFWADIRAAREVPAQLAEESAPAIGNELLAAWGRPARDMQALLADDLGSGSPAEIYEPPEAPTRLAALQRDVLELREIGDANGEAPPMDDSLQIHACHSAMREAEVLHDRLQGLFDAHSDIEPADVLVLAPSLTDYAPAIEAVFESAGVIPVNVGRLRRQGGAAVQAFLDLLALPTSRYGAQGVLAPLRCSAVQARFGMEDGDLATLGGWLDRAGIRWAIDADHLRAHGVASNASHTWRAGIRRLLLGYAIDEEAAIVRDIVPCGIDRAGLEASSDDYERLGRFLRYCEHAFALRAWAERSQPWERWADDLRECALLPFFALDGPDGWETDAVASLIDGFATQCELAECTRPIPFAVVRQVLSEAAGEATRAVARLADGATVGQLATGQVFPAKVVCVVGMNDRAFPRHVADATFDLVGADDRRPGDRNARDEDRFAFLEALLAARRSFVVTYTGRDLREDAALPPSVLVSELAEYMEARFPGDTAIVEHPLQPFNRRYFDAAEPSLFSYSDAMAAAANALGAKQAAPPRRFEAELPAEDVAAELDIGDLAWFAANPVRFFMERRLGLRLRQREDEVADEEPLEADWLRNWQLKNEIFALREADVEASDAATVLRARGLLSESNLGDLQYGASGAEAASLAEALAPFEIHRGAPPVDVDVAIGDVALIGVVAGYCETVGQLVCWRVGGIRPRDRIAAWLKLLAVACAVERAVEGVVIGSGANALVRLRGPSSAAARGLLADWIAVWRKAHNVALPFFPNTSWAWASADKAPLRKARAEWYGNQWGERQDEYVRLAFPEEPFGPAFEELAEKLLGPLAKAVQR